MKYRVQPATLHRSPGFLIVDAATEQQAPGTGYYTAAGERDATVLCEQLNAAYSVGAANQEQLVHAAREVIRTELFFQDHPQKYAAQQALRTALAAIVSAS
jgi:hypothetical protein